MMSLVPNCASRHDGQRCVRLLWEGGVCQLPIAPLQELFFSFSRCMPWAVLQDIVRLRSWLAWVVGFGFRSLSLVPHRVWQSEQPLPLPLPTACWSLCHCCCLTHILIPSS